MGVKQSVWGGAFSTWLLETVHAGGDFVAGDGSARVTSSARRSPTSTRRGFAISAGSPASRRSSSLLEPLPSRAEPRSQATLLLSAIVEGTSSIMFLEEFEDLKNRYPDRFTLVHVLSREEQEVELFSGRLDPEQLGRILEALVPVDSVDEWYLCGPFAMVTAAQTLLTERGADPRHVHLETLPRRRRTASGSHRGRGGGRRECRDPVTVNLDGRSTRIEMPNRAETILAATLRARPDAPYACTGGVCGTCRARLVKGEVRMDRNYALEPEELARGLVLACQSHPVTDQVELDYDA